MLEVSGLHRPGIDKLSFSIADSECVALMGPSGAGKSLLLRAIADLDPNEGDLRVGTRLRAAMPAPLWRRSVRYLAAETGWWLPVAGDHFRDRQAAEKSLATLGLPAEALNWPVARLSTGEKQRLALARALEGTPCVLLLDEPTAALDAKTVDRAEAVLRQRLACGVSILMATHDMAQARRMATRLFFMEKGHLTERPLSP
jgi:phosphate-transporting ATPase